MSKLRDKDCPECGGIKTLEARELHMGRGTLVYICKNEDCLNEEEFPV